MAGVFAEIRRLGQLALHPPRVLQMQAARVRHMRVRVRESKQSQWNSDKHQQTQADLDVQVNRLVALVVDDVNRRVNPVQESINQ